MMQMTTDECTISKMAILYSISPRALRFYEAKGLINPIRIGTSRLYTSKDRLRVEVILKGKKLGFSLDEIAKLLGIQGGAEGETAVPTDVVSRLDSFQIRTKLSLLEQKREIVQNSLLELCAELNLRRT